MSLWAKKDKDIETIDIQNFWAAYDLLDTAKSYKDSVKIIQREYLNKATDHFKSFIRIRRFTAVEYVKKIRLYPKFWQSIRLPTENIAKRKDEIEAILDKYEECIPYFRRPDICFAIGCLRSGGTTEKGLILIGAEIAASTPAVDKSEMKGWLASVIGNTGDIISMVAHEAIHTQQFDLRLIRRNKNLLLEQSLKEGVADFLTTELFGLNINASGYIYGEEHECELWKEFEKDLEENPRAYQKWLYQGNSSKDRPADLGYYIGHKIARAYYIKQKDKRKAIRTLLNIARSKKILEKSGYHLESCPQ